MLQKKECIEKWLRRFTACAAAIALTGTVFCPAFAAEEVETANSQELKAKSVILMEQSTGQVLFEQNADEQMPPASITKIMTMLLVMEALEDGRITLEQKVACSPHANSMGGSQIWLKVGEEMTVHELLKATAVASANDAAVALAEAVGGSEEGFVELMNQRAQELGMTNTHFCNASGLDEEGHLTTARDIALMSRELMTHEKIQEYTTIWMDSLRDGATQLVNTNRLVRFYQGATGLKTGTTSGAGSCLSATASRGGLSLIAVSLGSPTSDDRFETGKKLLDYGFSKYSAVSLPSVEEQLTPVRVRHGMAALVGVAHDLQEAVVVKKGEEKSVTQTVELEPEVTAPVQQGQQIGQVIVRVGEQELLRYPLKAAESVEKITFGRAFLRLMKGLVAGSAEVMVSI